MGQSSREEEHAAARDSAERPEFGEYATPEEQAAAIARWNPNPKPKPAADPVVPTRPASSQSDTGARSQPTRPPTTANTWNRMITIFLVAVGLMFLVSGISGYLNLSNSIDSLYSQMGIGEYKTTDLTAPIGIAIIVAQSIIWLVTAGWSYSRLTRGRSSWWVPIVGAAATFVASAVALGILLNADPAFQAYVLSRGV
ncbi:MAG: hypothetical protein KF742_03040 [Cryobacterium sp.]|nr:hypothetical protein [Cryobacterium sp.]